MTKAGEAVVEHAADQPVLAAEVVVHRGVVAVAGGRTDLSERHAVDAVFGEQSFHGDDDAFLGRTRLRRHGSAPDGFEHGDDRDGLNGASGANAPTSANASLTALATAAEAPITPPSPTPLWWPGVVAGVFDVPVLEQQGHRRRWAAGSRGTWW